MPDPWIYRRPDPVTGVYDLIRANGTTETRHFRDRTAAAQFAIDAEPWLEEEMQYVEIRENTTGFVFWRSEENRDDDRTEA